MSCWSSVSWCFVAINEEWDYEWHEIFSIWKETFSFGPNSWVQSIGLSKDKMYFENIFQCKPYSIYDTMYLSYSFHKFSVQQEVLISLLMSKQRQYIFVCGLASASHYLAADTAVHLNSFLDLLAPSAYIVVTNKSKCSCSDTNLVNALH